MSNNRNLTAARVARNDEFYTMESDIAAEVAEYPADTWQNKTIMLPCDDPDWSMFARYFAEHFDDLGLRRIIGTSYNANGRGRRYDIRRRIRSGERIASIYLMGDGDFRSAEVTRLRDSADIVVTNPPFSLSGAFIPWAMDGGTRKVLVLGNVNAVTYRPIQPLVIDGKLWLGVTKQGTTSMRFRLGRDSGTGLESRSVGDDGSVYQSLGNVAWFTNIDHHARHVAFAPTTPLPTMVRYDDHDAIEVPRVKMVPDDYHGAMGVPITFLGRRNPDQFDIVGFIDPTIDGRKLYKRMLIRAV